MTNTVQLFNPDILYSYNKLERFINDRTEIREIHRHKTDFPRERWCIAWLPENEYLRRCFSIYWGCIGRLLKMTGFALNVYGCNFLGRRLVILGSHLLFESASSCLKTSTLHPVCNRNIHQMQTSDFYLQDSIPRERINDRQILQMTAKNQEINFFREYGICLGSSLWFQYLYENTREIFSNPVDHIHAVANQFEKGAPLKAALLHSLNNFLESPIESIKPHARVEEDLLHLKVERYHALIPNEHLKGDKEWAKRAFEQLSCGSYVLYPPCHAVNFIKLSDSVGCLIDSNSGPFFTTLSNVVNLLNPYLTDPKTDKIQIDRFY